MNFEKTFQGRPNTVKTYKSLFKKHIQPMNQQVDWKNWNNNLTNNILNTWNNKNLSKNTKIILTRILSQYIEFMGGPKINTQKIIKSLKRSEQQSEVKALSKEEVSKLTEITKLLDQKFYPVLLLALHAGMRRGEIYGLRCGDIDILNGKIKISHSYNGPTKNGQSRIVPMSKELTNVLTGARNSLLRNPNELVFEKFDPNPKLKRLCKHAKIPQIRFHDLRHTFASLALENGINPKQVATWLGHSSVSTTLNIYWNLTNEKADLSFLPE